VRRETPRQSFIVPLVIAPHVGMGLQTSARSADNLGQIGRPGLVTRGGLMPAIRARNLAFKAIAFILLSVVCSNSLAATSDDPAAQAKRARSGGGLRVGPWQVVGLDEPGAPSSTQTVAAEGWYQKGFDVHIALESTLGFWQRTQTVNETG